MSSVIPGSETLIFKNEEDIIEHVLANILANKKRAVGTEWEMFLLDRNGMPISHDNAQKAFIAFHNVFNHMGYPTQFMKESTSASTILGINIPSLGTITPEAGYQFEFSCTPCQNHDEIFQKNWAFFYAIAKVSEIIEHKPIFTGHLPQYTQHCDVAPKSRARQLTQFYNTCFHKQGHALNEWLSGTASVQVTIDSGANNFNDFFRALLLIEPIMSMHYANSMRSNIAINTYGKLMASHVMPILSVWESKTPRQAVTKVIARLMQLDVPLLPNEDGSSGYTMEPLINKRPTTTKTIMENGRLNEKKLNNIFSFFYTRPALRNITSGLIEVRGIDSQPSPDNVCEIAQRIASLVYNDKKREKLLEDYEHLSVQDLFKLHNASTSPNWATQKNDTVASMRVIDIIDDVMSRTEKLTPQFFNTTGTEHKSERYVA